jgi:hypothetical protein
MPITDKLKSIGGTVFGLSIFVAVIAVIGLLIGGASWLSEHLLPWFVRASGFAFIVLLVVLLPLSAFRRSRSFTAVAILCVSYLFGATVWMTGLLATLDIWGTWGVTIGLCIAGVGVVPIAMLAALFHGMWLLLAELVVLTVLTFGSRFYAIWLSEMSEPTPSYTIE